MERKIPYNSSLLAVLLGMAILGMFGWPNPYAIGYSVVCLLIGSVHIMRADAKEHSKRKPYDPNKDWDNL